MHDFSNKIQKSTDLLILGAGMCGLTLARELSKHGNNSWLVIDKSKSVGGRMATRRLDGQKFDHWAQFFTARSQIFKDVAEQWLKDGVIKEWCKGFKQQFEPDSTALPFEDGHSRYMGLGGMNQIAKYISAQLPSEQVLLNQKIIKMDLTENSVILTSESGLELTAKSLVMTSPVPQTLDLLKSTGKATEFDSLTQELSQIQYDPCVAIMGFFDMDELPFCNVPIQGNGSAIQFLADNFSKGIASKKGALTVHLSGEVSRKMYDVGDQVVIDFVCDQLKLLFKVKNVSPPKSFSIQRWRFASPIVTLKSPYLEWNALSPSGPKILFAGEAFSGPKIEGAFLSGFAVGQRIVSKS